MAAGYSSSGGGADNDPKAVVLRDGVVAAARLRTGVAHALTTLADVALPLGGGGAYPRGRASCLRRP